MLVQCCFPGVDIYIYLLLYLVSVLLTSGLLSDWSLYGLPSRGTNERPLDLCVWFSYDLASSGIYSVLLINSLSLTSFTLFFRFRLAFFISPYRIFLLSSISFGNCSLTPKGLPFNVLGANLLTSYLSLNLSNFAIIAHGKVWPALPALSLCALSKGR